MSAHSKSARTHCSLVMRADEFTIFRLSASPCLPFQGGIGYLYHNLLLVLTTLIVKCLVHFVVRINLSLFAVQVVLPNFQCEHYCRQL